MATRKQVARSRKRVTKTPNTIRAVPPPEQEQEREQEHEPEPALDPQLGYGVPARYDSVGSSASAPRHRRRSHHVRIRRLSGRGDLGVTIPLAVLDASGLLVGEPVTIDTDGRRRIVVEPLVQPKGYVYDGPAHYAPEAVYLSKTERLDVEQWLLHAANEIRRAALATGKESPRDASKKHARADRCHALALRIGGRVQSQSAGSTKPPKELDRKRNGDGSADPAITGARRVRR